MKKVIIVILAVTFWSCVVAMMAVWLGVDYKIVAFTTTVVFAILCFIAAAFAVVANPTNSAVIFSAIFFTAISVSIVAVVAAMAPVVIAVTVASTAFAAVVFVPVATKERISIWIQLAVCHLEGAVVLSFFRWVLPLVAGT